jgi:hypothetical protein
VLVVALAVIDRVILPVGLTFLGPPRRRADDPSDDS